MNISKALEILHLDINAKDDVIKIKHQYHKLALLYHPDKCSNPDAHKRFIEIKQAYDYLTNTRESNQSYNYTDLATSFIESIHIPEFIQEIMIKFIDNYDNALLELKKENVFFIYKLLYKYKDILHVSSSLLEKIKCIIEDDTNIYILYPSLADLFSENLYKLYINDQLYYIPLWVQENIVETIDKEILIYCIPNIPPSSNIWLDEENNIYTSMHISLLEITPDYIIRFCIEHCKYEIPIEKLYIRPFQKFIIHNQGIPKGDLDTYQETQEKSNIILSIFIDFP